MTIAGENTARSTDLRLVSVPNSSGTLPVNWLEERSRTLKITAIDSGNRYRGDTNRPYQLKLPKRCQGSQYRCNATGQLVSHQIQVPTVHSISMSNQATQKGKTKPGTLAMTNDVTVMKPTMPCTVPPNDTGTQQSRQLRIRNRNDTCNPHRLLHRTEPCMSAYASVQIRYSLKRCQGAQLRWYAASKLV